MLAVYPYRMALATLALCAGAAAHAAPTLTPPPGTVQAAPGEPARVTYAVAWDATDHIAVLAPELPEISWGTATLESSQASSTEGASLLTLTVAVAAKEPGAYEWPAVRVPYVALAESGTAGPLDTTTVQQLDAAAIPLQFAAPWRWSLIWGGLAAGLGAIAAALALPWWRRRADAVRVAQADVGEAVSALVHEARRHRLDGDFYAFYKTLTRAAALTGAAKLAGKLEERTQSVGYRGVRPIDDDMDGDLRAVEQTLAGRREENPA